MDETTSSHNFHSLVKVMEDTYGRPHGHTHVVTGTTTVDGLKKKRKLKKCIVHACTSGARSRGLCKAHGGGKRCGMDGCNLSDQGGGFCIRHGGGKRCEFDGCDKSAQSKRFCKAHGGGVRCVVTGCIKSSQGGGKCRAHGGGPKWMRPSGSTSDDASSTTESDSPSSASQRPLDSSMSVRPTNSRLSLSVIEKIKLKNLAKTNQNVATMSPLRKDMPSLKTPAETLMRFTLPPLSIALQDKHQSAPTPTSSSYLTPKKDDADFTHNPFVNAAPPSQPSCIYLTCKQDQAPGNRSGFCNFHAAQFCCQVAGCGDKPVRGASLCANHHASSTLAKCLLHLTC
ncbi:hypothetical protein DYB32_007728 [Aphanomyces invadans]|uniref:WRKY19-like zinc finger domain-containing protein n=1 Tax=Aphanomyces invadans TaxID=157072 RepID=A0A418AMW4_9STRA|nr:hypothetical protein DYB32_007728 [Aphanomyces invadans]